MKITLDIDGGFANLPGLVTPAVVDTAAIDPHLGRQIESLVQQCRFFEQPAKARPPAPGAADYQTYTITVRDGSVVHTIKLTDPITDPTLGQLVSQIRLTTRTPS